MPNPSSAPIRSDRRHYFVDEAGDPVLFGEHNRIVVGEQGRSKFFILGMVSVDDPDALRRSLTALRAELLADPMLAAIPSMMPDNRKTAVMFHAKNGYANGARVHTGTWFGLYANPSWTCAIRGKVRWGRCIRRTAKSPSINALGSTERRGRQIIERGYRAEAFRHSGGERLNHDPHPSPASSTRIWTRVLSPLNNRIYYAFSA